MTNEKRWSCPGCRGNTILTPLEVAEIEGLISEAQVLITEGKGPASPAPFLARALEILDANKVSNPAR
jgi:hypothetical protein